jgi:hypothetical protein
MPDVVIHVDELTKAMDMALTAEHTRAERYECALRHIANLPGPALGRARSIANDALRKHYSGGVKR